MLCLAGRNALFEMQKRLTWQWLDSPRPENCMTPFACETGRDIIRGAVLGNSCTDRLCRVEALTKWKCFWDQLLVWSVGFGAVHAIARTGAWFGNHFLVYSDWEAGIHFEHWTLLVFRTGLVRYQQM